MAEDLLEVIRLMEEQLHLELSVLSSLFHSSVEFERCIARKEYHLDRQRLMRIAGHSLVDWVDQLVDRQELKQLIE